MEDLHESDQTIVLYHESLPGIQEPAVKAACHRYHSESSPFSGASPQHWPDAMRLHLPLVVYRERVLYCGISLVDAGAFSKGFGSGPHNVQI